MIVRVDFSLRQILWDLRAGMLWRPAVITVSYGLLALSAVAIERALPAGWTSDWLVGADPAAAQLMLGTVAGSMMTIVSIVYSLLVMALSLASMQFSPRILTGFISDRVSQTTLGVFVGTFTYALVVLRSIQVAPTPFVPTASVSLGLVLALVALGWLLYFIHHIAQGIQVNRIVGRICRDTEQVIDREFPEAAHASDESAGDAAPPPRDAASIAAPASGYIQLVDHELLVSLARERGLSLWMRRGPGEFAVEQNTLLWAAPAEKVTAEVREACASSFDIGDVRTLQQDVEFGIRQIVDMGLKAISPAVNDPSTAVTCIDHLGRVLCRLARRHVPGPCVREEGTGRLLVARRAVSFEGALDLAFNQLRQYGCGDMAVALRILRALTEITEATRDERALRRVRHHADLLEAGLDARFLQADRIEFTARLELLRARA